MKSKFRIGRKPEIPQSSKFDRLNPDDLYTCIEQAVITAQQALTGYRTDPSNREAYPHMAEAHLETALLATRSLIRRQEIQNI